MQVLKSSDHSQQMDRRVAFERQPLWNVAAVSSHQDVLEASHCASLTAGLRQLAGVVQHATAAFDKLHGQSTQLMERCQKAEARCAAMQPTFVLVQPGKTNSNQTSDPGDGQAVAPSIQAQNKAEGVTTYKQARPAEASEAIKAYRQVPADTDFSEAATSVPAAAVPVETLITDSAKIPLSPAPILQTAQPLHTHHVTQDVAVVDTVPLSAIPVAVQQILASDAVQTTQASSAAMPEASHPALTSADAAVMHGYRSSHVLPAVPTEQAAEGAMQVSTSTQSQPAAPVLQSSVATPESLDSDSQNTASDALASGIAREEMLPAYEDMTPQDSFTSASGFYSPRSQMASRRQSASSSEAWHDATSQMTSRASSITAPGLSATVPSSLPTGSGGRGLQSSARKSTRNLIDAIRQEKGLPSADDVMADQLAAQQFTPVTQTPAVVTQVAPSTAVQQIPVTTVLVQSASQQPQTVGNAPYNPSVESTEAHTIVEQSRQTATASVAGGSQPMLPQSALLELVSNPLYVRSLDVSRTTSTSPTRVETSTVARQAEPGAVESDLPMDNSLVQVSDQPILTTSEVSQATPAQVVSEAHLSEQPLLSSMGAVKEAAAFAVPAADETSVLQVSDAPKLTPEMTAEVDTADEAVGQQLSDHPILAVGDMVQDTSPRQVAHHQPTMLVSEQHTDTALADTGTGDTVAVFNQPILSQTDSSTIHAAQAQAAPVISSQPLLGPVIGHVGSSSTQQHLQQTPLTDQQPQVQSKELEVAQTAQLQPSPVAAMSSQPLLGPVISHTESSSRQLDQQQTLVVTSQQPQAQTRELQVSQQPAPLLPPQVPVATVRPEQTEASPQGLMLRPPVPALPSVRRSRSDLRSSLQIQSSSIRRSVSVLPAVAEAPQPAHRSSPGSQLRRSVTSLQASPVPQFDRSITASQVQLQQAAIQPAPVLMPPHFMPHMPLGPLQEGISAPAHAQAYDRSLVQTLSAAPAAQVVPIPVVPQAASPVVNVQQVQVMASSAPLQAEQPRLMQTQVLQQQPAPVLVQESRSFEASPQQSPGAVSVEQITPIFTDAESPRGMAAGPLAQQVPVIMHSQESSSPQMLQVPAAQQQHAPVFMSSINFGQQQGPAPQPPAMPAAPAYSPTQFLRTHTWSPSPATLQPAQPGQAVPVQATHGPLSMGVQSSWSAVNPALVSSQSTPVMRQQVATPVQQNYAYQQALPTSSTAAQYAVASRKYSPGIAPMSRPMYQEAGLLSGGLTQQAAPVNRRLYQQVSLPSPEPLRASAAPISGELYPQLGPLSGGLTQQGFPARRELYQQASLLTAATTSRAPPVSTNEGTVIQPLQGPVLVGSQSSAVATEPLGMQSPHGKRPSFSIQPLQSAAGPSEAMRQPARELNTVPGQAAGVGQLQIGPVTQTGGGHAKRALEAFGRASRSSLNADASVNNSYQSDRSMQQAYANEPQPAQRAESPPTPAVPPVSYFLNSAPVVTSYITPLPQPVPMPPPPAPFQMQPLYPAQGQTQVPRSSGRGPAFPAHLRSAVNPMQNSGSNVYPVANTQRTALAPPAVLPRVAVAAPAAASWYPQNASWGANSSAMMIPPPGQSIVDAQQASGSQDSSGQFRFLPGQRSSQDSQSTPSLSNRSVPKFLEDAWARGEPQQQGTRQGAPPPPPPPPPGVYVAQMQGLAGQRRSLASDALAGWHGSGDASQATAPQPAAQDQGSSAGTTALREEPSLYQSPLSHQSISSFGSPSPRPSAATPSQVTPATPQPPPQPTGAPNDLLASIRTSQFHLRKMSSSFQPTGISGVRNAQGSAEQGGPAAQPATLAALPPAGSRSRNRRSSGSTVGMDTAVARRMQANRASMYPESTYSDSEWGE